MDRVFKPLKVQGVQAPGQFEDVIKFLRTKPHIGIEHQFEIRPHGGTDPCQ